MRRLRLWTTIVLFVAAIGGAFWLWWTLDLRWRPHTVGKDQAQIAKLLDGAGWVAPHLPGPRLYLISYRDCPDCVRFETQVMPKLEAVGVDTRVIMIARADRNGLPQSTPAERSTVAELWLGRDWNLYQRWLAASPPSSWTAPGLAPADGDQARTAVVGAGRQLVEDLKPLLKKNGIKVGYPTLIWWNKAGAMRACACENPGSYGPVEKELGA